MSNNPDSRNIYPHFLVVDLSNGCNLRCPLCQTGQGEQVRRAQRMHLENYKKIVTPLSPWLFQVFLYNWGEPFLNKDIYDILAFNNAQGIGSVISTNANLPINAARLVSSGLDHLVISGDGITQEVYEKYRRGGSLEKVIENVRAIVKEKRKQQKSRPTIEWNCLVTRHNEHQLDLIRQTVTELGVDEVRFANINFYSTDESADIAREWLPHNPRYRKLAPGIIPKHAQRRPCFWLWRTAIVNADGTVSPCCLYDTKGWGNALETPLLSIWRNTFYEEARKRSHPRYPKKMDIICDSCTASFIWK